VKRFNRFELKYVVTAVQAEAMKEDLVAQMGRDSHESLDGAYSVTSLYYDTADLAFMRAKIEGIKFRRKLRIRRYGDEEDGGSVFVEIKQRINRTTQKRRMTLPLEQAYLLCAGQLEETPEDEADADVAAEVTFLARALALQPTCLVGYRRNAFVGGRYEPGLRVTFDNSLWTAVASEGLSSTMPRHAIASPSMTIMEVKANEAVPLWLANMLARHGCELRRFSKYCAGAELLRRMELLSLTPAPELSFGVSDERVGEKWMN
jgi:SPX domain protein involved in polyphosphate accumulation